MRRVLWAGLLALAALALVGTDALAVEQADINKAIKRGVKGLLKLRRPDGTWPHDKIGATALAGLTLLECDVPSDDKVVQQTAAAVRKAIVDDKFTYSISLALLFLDRLDDPADTALIESLTIRLLAGQNPENGGWGYYCPEVNEAEVRRLRTHIKATTELKGRRELPSLPAKGKRNARDLSKEAQAQLISVLAGKALPAGIAPQPADNSNTQFATLALWVGRRYGFPVGPALARIEARFRASQLSDGGWSYTGGGAGTWMGGTTATMTCAGLLGLAVTHGGRVDVARARNPKAPPRDVSKDKQLRDGLQILATAVGKPTGKAGGAARADGKAYYFLWSLERLAVALNLETIGKKDWYAWGAEVLLANQQSDGTWHGEYGSCGADTCFALLFLKRSNLTRDLTGSLRGLRDPGEKVLVAGGVGGAGLKGVKPLKPVGIGEKPPREGKPAEKPVEAAVARLTDELVKAPASGREKALEKLRNGKGVQYTEALVGAIGKLDGENKRKAREALADRLTRMKPATLREYMKDEEAEIRRAAALAGAMKDARELVPDLIRLLNDPELIVERAAHAALKALSGKDFGPAASADKATRAKAVAAWQEWWKKHGEEK
jgi:hypothetical protein